MDSMDHQDLGPAVQRIASEILPAMQGDIRLLDGTCRRMAIEMIGVKAELGDLKTMYATKTDFQRLYDLVEGFAGKTHGLDVAKTIHGQALTEAQVKLIDHERRIKGLEDRLQ